MTTAELRLEIELAKQVAYKRKTKAAQVRAWDKVRHLERQLLDIMYAARDKYATFSFKATVIADNKHVMSEHIGVKDVSGKVFWISPCNDILSKSWYASTCCVEYTEGQEVIVEAEVDVCRDSLKLILVPKRLYGGTLNQTKYEELCKKGNLAFFKYPDGRMSGLFSSK